jgi:hypothetical protein
MTIPRFPPAQICDDICKLIIFVAYVGEGFIACSISLEALQDHFDGDIYKPLETFICNRPAIEHIAERLIALRRFEANGSVLISTSDC